LDFGPPVILHPTEAGQRGTHVTVDTERADDGGREGDEAAVSVEAAAAEAAAAFKRGRSNAAVSPGPLFIGVHNGGQSVASRAL